MIDSFSISFTGEAGELFNTTISAMPDYGVTVTTEDGEKVEGYLVGVDREADWYGAVIIAANGGDWDIFPGSPKLTRRKIVAKDILVH